RMIQAADARPDRPSREHWNTAIPAMLLSGFTNADLRQVHECMAAVEPIEARGIKVVTRIELAAAFLASACQHAYESKLESTGPEESAGRFAATEEIVVQRAREIYSQGHE